VRGEGDGHAAGRAEVEQQVEDGAAGARGDVAGRFVGEQEDRVTDEGAGDRDALLLAAGELGGERVLAALEADRV
jgi:hypothetical protein